jgi:hypothetical protein
MFCSGHINTIPVALPVVVREIRSNAYSPLPFYLVKFVSDIPIDVLGTIIFASLLEFMSGMSHDSGPTWIYFVLIYFAATFIGNAVGQWAAILAPATAPFVGLVVVLLVVIPQFLFCGVLILLDQIPVWWFWMADISVFRYFLELIMRVQWRDYGDIPCTYTVVNGNAIAICPFPNGQAVLDFYGLNRPPLTCALIIIAWWVVFKLLGYRALLQKCNPPASAFGGPPPDDATAETMPSGDDENVLLKAQGTDVEAASGGEHLRRRVHPITLRWEGLGLSAMVREAGGGKGAPPVCKALLHGLHGRAEPGQLVAVMGGSGSGKSVLLRTLGSRQTEGRVEGRVTYNGSPWSPSLARHVAFMGQEDHFLAEVRVALPLDCCSYGRPSSSPRIPPLEFHGNAPRACVVR